MSGRLGGVVLSVYSDLPRITAAATVGAMLSVASRWATKRVSLPNATTTFNFIATTCVALHALKRSISFINQISPDSGLWTSGGSIVYSTLYGLHITSNPQRTFIEFAQLSVLALVSIVGVTTTIGSKRDLMNQRQELCLDKMSGSLLINNTTTAAAAGSAWVVSHLIGLDPHVTLLFTATMSALYYTTKPLFAQFESHFRKNNYGRRALSLLYLAKFSADRLKIESLQTFAKTCAVAGALIALFDWANGSTPKENRREAERGGGYPLHRGGGGNQHGTPSGAYGQPAQSGTGPKPGDANPPQSFYTESGSSGYYQQYPATGTGASSYGEGEHRGMAAAATVNPQHGASPDDNARW